jgi:NodT family efflux transporter outer membrane factor (OMF) lipoprotein
MPDAWAGVPRPDAQQPPGATVAVPTPPDIARWWTILNDAELTSLIERAVAANLGVQQAEARLRQARAAKTIAASALFPDVTASGSATRSRTGGSVDTPTGPVHVSRTRNLFRAGFDAAWEIDIFGGTRRAVESADAGVQSAIEDQRDVLVSLVAEVATNYYELRGGQLELAISQRNLDAQRQSLDLTRERLRGGYISALDVANAESQVASTLAGIPTIEASVRESMYAISVLLGQPPATLVQELSVQAPLPPTPPQVPVGLPSDLLRRRPDIRRAEATLHVATARIGVAVADLYPRFAITGTLGFQGSTIGAASNWANRSWSIGPSFTWPIFTAGRVRANIEGERAATDETYAAYQQSVLTALQEVETALIELDHEQLRRQALIDAVDADQRAVSLSTQLYTAGRTDFLNVLAAQRALYGSETALSRSNRLVVTDLVALYKALGGGWEDPEASDRGPGAAGEHDR